MKKYTKEIIDKLNTRNGKVDENTFSFDAKILIILDDIADILKEENSKDNKNVAEENGKKADKIVDIVIGNIDVLIESEIQYILSEIIISLENIITEEQKEKIVEEIIKYYIEVAKVERDKIRKEKQLEKIYLKITEEGNIQKNKKNNKVRRERKLRILKKNEEQILKEFKEIILETENREKENKRENKSYKKLRLEDIKRDLEKRKAKLKKEKAELNEEIKKEKIYNLAIKYEVIRVLNTLEDENKKLDNYISLIRNDVITINTKLDITLLNLDDEYIIRYFKNIIKINSENIIYTYDVLEYIKEDTSKMRLLLEIIEENDKEKLKELNECKFDKSFLNQEIKLSEDILLKIIELTPKMQSIKEERILYVLYSLVSEEYIEKYGKELFESYVSEDTKTYVSKYNSIKKEGEIKNLENIIPKNDIYFDVVMQVSGGLPVSMITYLKNHLFYYNENNNTKNEKINKDKENNKESEDRIKIIEDPRVVSGKKIILKNLTLSKNDLEIIDNILAFLRYSNSNTSYDSLLEVCISTKYFENASDFENLINEWKVNKNIIPKMLYYNEEHETDEVRKYNRNDSRLRKEKKISYVIRNEYDILELKNNTICENEYNKDCVNFLNILKEENKKSIAFNIFNYSLEYERFMYNIKYYIQMFEAAIEISKNDNVLEKYEQMIVEESENERAKILLDILFNEEKALSILMLKNDTEAFKMKYYNNYIENSKDRKLEKEYIYNIRNIEKEEEKKAYFDNNEYRSLNENLRRIKKVLIAKK